MLRKYYIAGLCLCVTVMLTLSACGKTGDLYLPDDDKPGKSASAKS